MRSIALTRGPQQRVTGNHQHGERRRLHHHVVARAGSTAAESDSVAAVLRWTHFHDRDGAKKANS